jgi:dihydropteroate synthase
MPVIEALRDAGVPLSVDTRRPAVMRAALEAGASMVNDVCALAAPGAIDVVRDSECAVCLMHMRGDPSTMQAAPHYVDVVSEVREFLRQRVVVVRDAGVAASRIAADPGFGFGKVREHNLALLRHLEEFTTLGVALLVGMSRKATLGALTGRAVGERMSASVAAALLAAERGAKILRVHDVRETADALAVWRAVSTEIP